jgi:3-oxoacyl-[acyl-carrier-protein] synthase-3
MLGAKKAVAFDISAACSGFIYGLITAQQFISTGYYNNILVVGCEVLSKITDWQDRSTCVLLGDGAGAAVLKRGVNRGNILASYLETDGSQGDILIMPAGGSRNPTTKETIKKRMHYLKMEGNKLFKIVVSVLPDVINKVLKKAGISLRKLSLLIPHQANTRIVEAVAKKVGISMDKIYMNIDKCGNTSSASIPLAMHEALKSGRIKSGDKILLVSFGGGLTFGAAVIEW